jgi:hypothetical protein
MPPLYFQHDGHSRTIIGIERKKDKLLPKSALNHISSGRREGAAAAALWFHANQPPRSTSGSTGGASTSSSSGQSNYDEGLVLGDTRIPSQGDIMQIFTCQGRSETSTSSKAAATGRKRPPTGRSASMSMLKYEAGVSTAATTCLSGQGDPDEDVSDDGYVYNLLVLDPGISDHALKEALR